MKILIIGQTKIKFMPFIQYYFKTLTHAEVEIVFWNRDENDDVPVPPHIVSHEFIYKIDDTIPLYKKIPGYLKFRTFVKKVLRHTPYDFLIVLCSPTCVILADILLTAYRKKFLFDYRDHTYENNRLYRALLGALCRRSLAMCISSDAFRKNLPALDHIYRTHNFSKADMTHYIRRERSTGDKIIIRTWGLITYARTNIRLIQQIADDERFELYYHGRYQGEAQDIINFCKKNDISNVYFHGEYHPDKRFEFAAQTDILQNAQDVNQITVHAVSNKFYDGLIFKIPQLCSKNTHMGELLQESGVGFLVDFDSGAPTTADEIFNWYMALDKAKFCLRCDSAIEECLNDLDKMDALMNEIQNANAQSMKTESRV